MKIVTANTDILTELQMETITLANDSHTGNVITR